MTRQQNPVIPAPISAIEIDAAILDIQLSLDTALPWLTHAYGRAYQLQDTTRKGRLYLPEVYLGKQNGSPRYFDATPDNDKQGQCLFFVSEEQAIDPVQGQYGWLDYSLSIIFSVNLELINSGLLDTELFTSHLIADVREVLIRQNLGTFYRLTYDRTLLDTSDTWQGFDLEIEVLEKAPLQHFRMEFTLQIEEDCTGLPYDRCSALLSKLTQADRNGCILPSYDFSNLDVQGSLTAVQVADLTDFLCGAPPIVDKSLTLDNTGIWQYITTGIEADYDFEYNTPFSMACWVKPDNVAGIKNLFNHYSTSGADRGYFVIITGDNRIRVDLQSDGGAKGLSVSTPSSAVTLGDWNHILFAYAGTPNAASLNIYINGVLQAKEVVSDTLGNDSIKQPTLPLWFGLSMTGLNGFDGLLSDMRIWDTDLNAVDVTAEYNNKGKTTPVQPLNNIGWCKCGDSAVFGVDTWAMQDFSNTVAGYKTIGVPSTALSVDVPL